MGQAGGRSNLDRVLCLGGSRKLSSSFLMDSDITKKRRKHAESENTDPERTIPKLRKHFLVQPTSVLTKTRGRSHAPLLAHPPLSSLSGNAPFGRITARPHTQTPQD